MMLMSVLALLATLPLHSGKPVAIDNLLGGKGRDLSNAFLRQRIQSMSAVPTPVDLEAMKKAQVKRKKELLRTLGLSPMPPKTPLNAKITGVLHCQGYRIEKLAFESRPNFFVTAHVYVPEPTTAMAGTRWPVIMNVNGHWNHKKDEDRIQLRCAFQALRGFLAIAVDSPGFSFEGNNLIERRAEGDHQDWTLVEGGANATGYYVWDTIRALDYIATRPDTDMNRAGITGASGGGLATLYAFAADDRYKVAIPVVYMSSAELAPDNGCLCNHVPGTSQIGDRSDIIAIQAPKPVLIIGAQRDGEFPPAAMNLTHEKMAKSWALFDRAQDVQVKIFAGGHDYSQPMREAALGFFEQHILVKGDGQPIPEPAIKVFNSEDHSLLALDPPIAGERTMRELAKESLAKARKSVSAQQAFAVNGGLPTKTPLNAHFQSLADITTLTFEAEPNLITPALERHGSGSPKKLTIFLDDGGKNSSLTQAPAPADGEQQAFIDVLGTGELADFELRYLWYAGRSAPFVGGWQVVRLIEALKAKGIPVEIKSNGPVSGQAAMWAALMQPGISSVAATDCLAEWSDVFKDGVSPYAVQPRANLCGSLAHLESLVKNGKWQVGK